jgi:TetR/AcrR family transcriptional regulator, fatty acid metabolism regulator protein
MSETSHGVRSAVADERGRRRDILRAAIRVFAHKGYHACRVGDVAAEAGVAYGLVYHYFGSKQELLEEVFRRTWANLLEALHEIEESGGSAREQLDAIARFVFGTWRSEPDLMRVLVREVARTPQLQREIDEIAHAFAALERVVVRGQERGELRRDIDARLASWIVYGVLEEILTGWVFGRLPDTEDDVEAATLTVVSVLTDGLRDDPSLTEHVRR